MFQYVLCISVCWRDKEKYSRHPSLHWHFQSWKSNVKFTFLCAQFHLSPSDKQRYAQQDTPEAQRQLLLEISQKLPVHSRSASGGDQTLIEAF